MVMHRHRRSLNGCACLTLPSGRAVDGSSRLETRKAPPGRIGAEVRRVPPEQWDVLSARRLSGWLWVLCQVVTTPTLE